VQRQERRTRSGGRIGIVTLSDPSGQFEATIYQERLAEWRDLLEPGQSLMLQIGAEIDETEEIRARIHGVEPLEAVAARRSQAIRVFVRDAKPIERLAGRLGDAGDGSVTLIVLLDGREVEIKLPGGYRVTPQVAGAIKAVPGIVDVHVS
jgi:DNA polymerase-3 subunit alpha